MSSNAMLDQSAFDTKASSLIATTQHLTIPQILMVRRMTLHDPESLRWASVRQLNVVFDVVLTNALDRFERANLLAAVDRHLEPLLPPPESRAAEDVEVLTRIVNGVLRKKPAQNKKQSEAEKVIVAFENLLSRRLPPTITGQDRANSPFREPTPLFSAQGGLRATSAARRPAAIAADDHAAHNAHNIDFGALFDETIIGLLKSSLEQLQVPPNYPNPMARPRLPFIVAAEFTPVFEDVVRRFILPQMKASRQVKTLANTYDWAQVGGEQLITVLQGSEINNPILHNWDLIWNNYKNDTKKVKESPWTVFDADAQICKYYPPDRNNIRPILDLIRYEPEAMDKCWKELSSLAQQEFSPSGRQERAREGALRDGLLKWSAKLPDYVGEFIAIKAAFCFPACDADYMRALVNNFGRSEQDRQRNAPYLSQFVADQSH